MNRYEAIESIGLDIVESLEKENCVETNTVNENFVEFISSIDKDDLSYHLYYYVTKEEFEKCEELDQIDWDGAEKEYYIV